MMKTKRYILVLALCSLFFLQGRAQISMLSVGVRGGGQLFLPTAAAGATGEFKPGLGGAGALDLRYSYYGNLTNRFGLGFAVGAGFGYGTAGIQGTNTDVFTNTDYLNNQIDYTVSSVFAQTDRFAKIEASLLLAMRFGGVTLNVGPRLMLPMAASSAFTITSTNIDAYYPAYNVHVSNQQITGKLETPYAQPATPSIAKYNVLIALEIGYEWALNDKHIFGVQAFADIAVWSPQAPISANSSPFISVSAITDASNPVPTVTVNAPNGIAGKRFLDFGIRAYYAFSFSGTHQNRRSPSRDTRLHHNRYRWY